MILGIIGLPQTGKKTIFELLSGMPASKAPSRDSIIQGMAAVRDRRIDRLSAMYKPKRTKYAEFELALPPAIQPDNARSAAWLDPIRRSEALVHVIRAFESENVFHIMDHIDPARDIETVELEFLFADLALCETRLERLKKEMRVKNSAQKEQEKAVIERCLQQLQDEKPLRSLEFDGEEFKLIRSLQFLSLKPVISVFNIGEDFQNEQAKYAELAESLRQRGDQVVFLSAAIEQELLELEEEERRSFMADLGLEEPAAHRLSMSAYSCLGLMSFFTCGPDEVRAWPLKLGSSAPEAAGKIHSDLQRGFIRAETISYEQLMQAGSERAAKEAKLYKLNGKDYIVQDGDIIEIRFNV
ncbi:MAG: redox-regulated ATPase YchF [Lentisphaeria bacterium]|jgi:GTP-binding protein YchF|nr:redox-regulated ATPase YchF [Lentisphaeria bacterium]NLZ59911.1 redox-regulated ATPase YchF [Lentisphaerota bacterium]